MQATMSEEAYQDETAAVSLKLSQPHVRDVWEERMPLALEAALSVGCVASVAPALRSRPPSEGYELVELQVHVRAISANVACPDAENAPLRYPRGMMTCPENSWRPAEE